MRVIRVRRFRLYYSNFLVRVLGRSHLCMDCHVPGLGVSCPGICVPV